MPINFKKYAADGEYFLSQLAKNLSCPDDKAKAGRILRASIHALRNHLQPNESLQLISQFPMFLKALYVDGWKHWGNVGNVSKMDDFLNELRKEAGTTWQVDFPTDKEAERLVKLVFVSLRTYISLGEIEDIKAMMPKELKSLFNQDIFI